MGFYEVMKAQERLDAAAGAVPIDTDVTTEELERLVAAHHPIRVTDDDDGFTVQQSELELLAPALAREVVARREWAVQARRALVKLEEVMEASDLVNEGDVLLESIERYRADARKALDAMEGGSDEGGGHVGGCQIDGTHCVEGCTVGDVCHGCEAPRQPAARRET